MKNLRLVLDTHRLNFRMTQWPITVLDPFEEAARIVEAFDKQKAAIDVDQKLTPRVRRRRISTKSRERGTRRRHVPHQLHRGGHARLELERNSDRVEEQLCDFLIAQLVWMEAVGVDVRIRIPAKSFVQVHERDVFARRQ